MRDIEPLTRSVKSNALCTHHDWRRLGIFLLILFPCPSHTQTYTWKGGTSDQWSDGENWEGGSPPVSGATNTVNIWIDTGPLPVIASGITFQGTALNIGSASASSELHIADNSVFTLGRIVLAPTSGLGIFSSSVTVSNSIEVGASDYGWLTVSGPGAQLSILGNNHLTIGGQPNGDGHVLIANGGKVSVYNVSLANTQGSGSLTVDGPGSELSITGRDLSAAGMTGDATIQVSNGGKISIVGVGGSPSSRGLLQLGSNYQYTSLTLTGPGSAITTTGAGRIGEFGRVGVLVDDRATLDIGDNLLMGWMSGSQATMTIDREAEVTVAGDTAVGYAYGSGFLTLLRGGTLRTLGEVGIGIGASTHGVINIGAAAGDSPAEAGNLDTGSIYFGNGDATLVFNHTTTLADGPYLFAPVVHGNGRIDHHAGYTQFTAPDSSAFSGTTTIHGGSLRIDGRLGGTMNVESAGHLQGIGIVGDLTNRGVVAPGNSIGVLTVAGNYVGDGGELHIETVLGGDASPTDMLVVQGDTSGLTRVVVQNVGGSGAQTVEGIKIVDVWGASNGTFSLVGDFLYNGEPAVGAGLYGYVLRKNGISNPTDGDWYLRSYLLSDGSSPEPEVPPMPEPIYHPGVPLYETLPRVALGLMRRPTLQQRVGNRSWQAKGADGNSTAPANTAFTEGSGFWGRVDGEFLRLRGGFVTTDARLEQRQGRGEVGLDFLTFQSAAGTLIGGLSLHYGQAFAEISSPFGRGRNETTAFGFGGTATWYGSGGFYADAQASLSRLETDLQSHTLDRALKNGVMGFGHAMSLELGQRFPLGATLGLVPQAQLTWAGVHYDRFTDPFGAVVSDDRRNSLQARIGLALQHERQWTTPSRLLRRLSLHAIANVYQEFLEGVSAKGSGVRLANDEPRTWAGLGLGGSYNFDDDVFSLYGEVNAATNLSGRGGNYRVDARLGLRSAW